MRTLRRISTSHIGIAAIAALLAMSGAAIAANGGPGGEGDRQGRGHGGPGGPAANKYLTYSEVHTYRRGTEKTIRLDAGKLVSVDADSITISRRDGVEVTTAIDEDTEIRVRGVEDATTDDLTVGKRVIVSGEKDETADVVAMPANR